MEFGTNAVGLGQPTAGSTAKPALERPATSQRIRSKRVQVARACEGCRVRRIKCDNKKPCANCEIKGRHCSNNDPNTPSNLQQAFAEIERLRRKVRELEAELQELHDKVEDQPNSGQLTPPNSSPSVPDQSESPENNQRQQTIDRIWDGIHIRPIRSSHASWFGPSSLYYFVHRLSIYLSSNLHQAHQPASLLPDPVASGNLLQNLTINPPEGATINESNAIEDHTSKGVFLNSVQEEYFINFFWHTYHTSILPILDEEYFKKHYQSLWAVPGGSRKSSALVDMVIAICMQHGVSTLPSKHQGGIIENIDATVAGRWYYRRAQALLAHELESPTISTLQCHLLSTTYLCGGSFHNMVETAGALALRAAHTLGLHLEPPANLPDREREMRRRLWWAIYLMDSKIGMKLGRPFLVPSSSAMPRLPSDSLNAAVLSGSSFAPIGDNATWLSFHLYQIKLYSLVRTAHTEFYGNGRLITDEETIWANPASLEIYAGILMPHMKYLDEWVEDLPTALKTQRQQNGCPLSTDQSKLQIEQFAPIWLQRQRILLELVYHHLCHNLYRALLSFEAAPSPGSRADATALQCVAHAIAFSQIAQQVLSETSILDGWHEAFHWQWNTAITLVGFVLVYPQSSVRESARNAIDLALSVFDTVGANFAVAANAAKIIRGLLPKVDFLTKTRREQNIAPAIQERSEGNSAPYEPIRNQDAFLGHLTRDGEDGFSNVIDMADGSSLDFLNMAVNIDFWGDMDMLWPGDNNFIQQMDF